MSYLVLARKWRPQVFEEVVGQRPITQTLRNAISQKRVAHAFLFTGARGVGKTSTARILAKALNCEKGSQTNPCNQCVNCREITDGNSIDVIEIDGASNRGIEEIRELRENVRYTPAKSKYKIYIIDEVHMLTREAFNALLKTLEEPPPHIIFVFATTEPHKIPSTILSRCQRYDFKRIPLKEIIGSLNRIIEEEKIQISQRSLLLIARESEGSMRDAQSLLDQVISYGGKEIRDEDVTEVLGLIDQKILYDAIEAIADRDAERCIEIVSEVYHYGYDIQFFCRELLQYLRNLILFKVSEHPEELLEFEAEELEGLKRQAEKFQFEQLNHLFSLLLKGEEEVAQSTFPRTMLEITLIRMASLRAILPIDEIIEKLEGMGKVPSFPGKGQAVRAPEERAISPKPSQKGKKKGEEPERDSDSLQEKKVLENMKAPEESQRDGEAPSRERVREGEDRQHGEGSEIPAAVYEGTWKGLVDFTRGKSPILGSFLVFGVLLYMDDEKIEIGFEKDSFHYDRILERSNRSQLESICHEYFNKKVKVVISPVEQVTKTKEKGILNAGRNSQSPSEGRTGNKDGENSMVQEALRLFNGRIVEK